LISPENSYTRERLFLRKERVRMTSQPVALVTGGSRGIGRAICQALAREQFTVLINYNSNQSAAAETLDAIEKAGGKGDVCQADVSTPEHRHLLLDYCMETFGRLDLLVNNAGIAPPQRLDLLETTEANYDRVMRTNLKAAFFLTQSAARIMIKLIAAKEIASAKIVNVSSISAYTASVNRGEYCISKAGLSMVTQLFAARLAEHGIGVYEIRPGVIRTDMTEAVVKKYDQLIREGLTPIRRWGKPEDIGKAIAAIARGDLPFSTGEVINVDGGFHVRTL
jgi:NAD(P)-dependent dehydrogenase (short-subunit alcohol dehydrogenase family)